LGFLLFTHHRRASASLKCSFGELALPPLLKIPRSLFRVQFSISTLEKPLKKVQQERLSKCDVFGFSLQPHSSSVRRRLCQRKSEIILSSSSKLLFYKQLFCSGPFPVSVLSAMNPSPS